MSERRQAEEERRRKEEEERKRKAEEEKKAKEAEKQKRQAMMAGQFVTANAAGPNYQVAKKDKNAEKFDKFGNIVKAKAEMGMTKEQMLEQKRKSLGDIVKPLQIEGMDVNVRFFTIKIIVKQPQMLIKCCGYYEKFFSTT